MTNGVTMMPAGAAAKAARFPMTPARWLTLALGLPVLLVLVAWTAFSAVTQLGQASFPVHYRIPVSRHQVNAHIDGNVTLRQASVSTARLSGTAHYSLFRPTITVSGSTVRYHCPFPVGNCELNGTLQVPVSTAVSLSAAGGDLTVPDFAGNLTFRSAGGNVHIDSLTGRLQIFTAGGNVHIGTVSDQSGRLWLATDGGNITGYAIAAPRAIVQTAGGNVSLSFTQPPADLRITSDGGNVTLILPHGSTGYLVDASSDGGNVHVSKSVHQDSADSGHTIYVHTAGGNINISEAS